MIKRLFVENWRAKLMSLIVATAVWYLVKKNLDVSPERPGFDRRPAGQAPARR
jgi:hypothetical protein